jgi:REP element-mobilizing transposase RayT
MKLFKSNEPNTFHYVTLVTYGRVPIFRSAHACQIFVNTLNEVRQRYPYKLIGYVVMPDHAHAIVNRSTDRVSDWLRRVRGNSARQILLWLRDEQHLSSLKKLELTRPQKRNHTHAVWQKDPSVIDLWSPKFIRQKLNYLHMNPVRAGLCEHPAKWKWSSYRAYLPHQPDEIPIEIDWQGFWKDGEFAVQAGGQ